MCGEFCLATLFTWILMKPISMSAVRAGAKAFHAKHATLGLPALDVVEESNESVYIRTLLHDFLHFFFDLSVEQEDLLACIEVRLDSKCSTLTYLSEYTDRLPIGFQDLWNAYCIS